MSDHTNTLTDVYARLEHARERITDLWSKLEPAMNWEMREHYEISISEITKSQTAIENALGGFVTARVMSGLLEERGEE